MENEKNNTLVNEAIEIFEKNTRIKARYARGYLTIEFRGNKERLKMIPVSRIDEITVVAELNRIRKENYILVAKHVTHKKAELLKNLGIAFIDTTGNAFIDRGPLFVYIQGKKPKRTDKPVKIFKDIGVKLIFGLLCNPGLENKTYREIARDVGVALGGISVVFRDLQETGFLLKRGKKGLRLVNKDELLKRWVTAYNEQLHPKLILGRYAPVKGSDNFNVNKINLSEGSFWGGEIAADKLVKHLVPRNIIIYTNQEIYEIARKLLLKKDPDGNIQIIKMFWNFNWVNNKQTVPPLMIYANLLATGNERDIETAGIIYERELQKIIT